MENEIELAIRSAQKIDIDLLVELNESWQKEHLENDFSHGFLSARLSKEDFEAIVDNEEIVVASIGNTLIGYYIVNNYSERVSSLHVSNIDNLKSMGLIPNDFSVGMGAQALIQKEFQGFGIREIMLKKLITLLKPKYKLLYSTISKDNTKAYKAHTKDGWKVIHEDLSKFFVVIYT